MSDNLPSGPGPPAESACQDAMTRFVLARKLEEESRKKRRRILHKKRLLAILKKKVLTGFVGALARFEEVFGELWGHTKKPASRTAQEKKFFELWQRCRTEVLNNGNAQLRAVEAELALYEVHWNRHQVRFEVNRGGTE